MFFDNIQSQSNNQVTNLSNVLNIGSTDSGNGGFSPTNDNTSEFRSSNDIGASAGVAVGGGQAQGGAVAMSRQQDEGTRQKSFDGFMQPVTSGNKSMLVYGAIGFIALVIGVFGGSLLGRKKGK